MTSKPTQIDIDAEFARFQRTRAPAALGRVFDVAAPQLLLVAMHFCGDAAAAEDLVQTVFLQVLRDADQHEVGRPVLPWLLAVLQHRASDQRTANARRTRREAAVAAAALAGVGSVTVDDPARHAIDEETRKQVAAALAGLPAGYREVLALRLVHGLRAVDIAHSLGQPPATVRTRLRRGLGLLRDALPRGLAAPALLAVLAREALAARDGLPAIRDRLLRALPAATTGALGVTAKWLLAAAAVAVLLTGAFAIEWRGDRTSPSVAGDAVVASGPLAAPAQDGGDRRNRPAPNAGERAAAPPSSKVAIESPDGQVLVHGRVVAAETDAPLAGVEVMVFGNHQPDRGAAPVDWTPPAPVATTADGTFELRFAALPTYFFELEANAPGRRIAHRALPHLAPGADVDLGELQLEPGSPTVVTVTVGGRPATGIALNAGRKADDERSASTSWYGDTDSRGRIDLGRLAPGRYRYELECVFAGPRRGEFDVPLQVEPVVIAIALREPPRELTLRGTLVDERGAPVEGLELHLRIPGESPGYWTAPTAVDGAFLFALDKPWEGGGTWRFELPRHRRDLEWIEDGGELAWGTDDLRLVVRRRSLGALRVAVVDPTDTPVERFAIRLTPRANQFGTDARPAAADLPHHAGGVCDRRELRPGSYLLTVLPEEPFGERLWLPVEVREGGTETLRVELAARRELRVTVCRRGDGTPVAGADIALAAVHPADRVAGLALDDPILAVDEIRPLRGPGPVGSIRGVAVGRTDERGDVTLRAPAGHALVLGVRSPHAVSRVVALDAWPAAGESLRVEVDAGAVVRGQVRPLAFVERFGPRPEQLAAARADFANGIDVDPSTRFADDWPSVVLRRAGAEAPIVAAHVDCDGRFELAGVPAGSYEVWLEAVVRSSRRGGSTRDLGPVASITVDAAEAPAELALDAGPFVPARVRGTFFVDGEPWRGVAGFARLTARGNAPVVAERDPGGAYESQWLLPGRYLPFAHFEVRPGVDRYAYDLAPIDVGPGEEVEVRAVVTRRRLELVLRDAAGAPVADVRIRPEPIDRPEFAFEWRFGERTDAAGRIVLDPAPPGRLRLRAFALGEDPRKAAPSIDLGEIGADRREVELRWPLAAAGGR